MRQIGEMFEVNSIYLCLQFPRIMSRHTPSHSFAEYAHYHRWRLCFAKAETTVPTEAYAVGQSYPWLVATLDCYLGTE